MRHPIPLAWFLLAITTFALTPGFIAAAMAVA
jgi:hypothetical protein